MVAPSTAARWCLDAGLFPVGPGAPSCNRMPARVMGQHSSGRFMPLGLWPVVVRPRGPGLECRPCGELGSVFAFVLGLAEHAARGLRSGAEGQQLALRGFPSQSREPALGHPCDRSCVQVDRIWEFSAGASRVAWDMVAVLCGVDTEPDSVTPPRHTRHACLPWACPASPTGLWWTDQPRPGSCFCPQVQ